MRDLSGLLKVVIVLVMKVQKRIKKQSANTSLECIYQECKASPTHANALHVYFFCSGMRKTKTRAMKINADTTLKIRVCMQKGPISWRD